MGIKEHHSTKMDANVSPTLGELAEGYKDEPYYVLIIPDPVKGTAQCYAVLDEDMIELSFEALKGMAEAQLRKHRSGGKLG
jgi:hypothetical protein